MSLWLLLSTVLMFLAAIISLVAWVVSIIVGFKAHVGWGIANIFGGLCLFFIPQIIFSLLKLEERWPILVLVLGGIIPLTVGMVMGFSEAVLLIE